jgi:hypothetical protein
MAVPSGEMLLAVVAVTVGASEAVHRTTERLGL